MNRKPTFLWQGLLIVLPVLLLAAVGVVSLWKDRETVTLGARATAGQYGEQLAAFLAAVLNPELENVSSLDTNRPAAQEGAPWGFGSLIDAKGNLLNIGPRHAPGEFSRLPATAPFPLERLTEEATGLWTAARSAELVDESAAIAAYERFLATDPPEPLRANAEYARAVLLAATGRNEAALAALRSLQQTRELTEAGLPLAVLGEFQRVKLLAAELRQGNAGERDELRAAVDALCFKATEMASFATAPALRAAVELVEDLDDVSTIRVHAARMTWTKDENTRAFHRSVKPLLSAGPDAARAFWTTWNDEEWLVMLAPFAAPSTNPAANPETDFFEIQIYPESLVREAVEAVVAQMPARPPGYIEPIVVLQNRQVSKGEPGGELLTTVDSEWTVADHASIDGLQVGFRLVDADLLYAQQRQRAFWFGSLIVLAAAAALTGYLTARRAFHRQLYLNEMKSNFVASVSHELRAPIASVRLMAEGLERGTVQQPEKQRDYFKFIVQECRRLSSLIENVLDFSRIEQGRRNYEFEPTDVVTLVRHTSDLMHPPALERQIRLATRIAPELSSPALQPDLDGKAMQQALVNLIDNAIKHSPPNSTITVGLSLGNAGSLLLSVEDQGEGIPAAEHDRIFERFHRLGSELRRKTQGAGIGLSIVKHIVEAHRGTIHLHSKPGKGSRFTIAIPLNETS